MARHVRRPDRWHHDRRAPRPCGLVDGDCVVGRVRRDTGDLAGDRFDQRHASRRVIDMRVGQNLGHDHTRPVDAQMELLPATPAAGPVFRGRPLAFPNDGQTRAVEDQMDAFAGRDGRRRRVRC